MIEDFKYLRRILPTQVAKAGSRLLTALVIFTSACIALTSPAVAQDSETTDSRAVLVTPLSFIKDTDLDFGEIVPGNTDGFVTMDTAGVITATGGITARAGTSQPATFRGYGSFNQRVLINIDQNSYLLTRLGGTETMVLDQVSIGSNPPLPISTNPRRFRIVNPDGFFAFTIVGRLAVAANQAPGIYETEFIVTLEYE